MIYVILHNFHGFPPNAPKWARKLAEAQRWPFDRDHLGRKPVPHYTLGPHRRLEDAEAQAKRFLPYCQMVWLGTWNSSTGYERIRVLRRNEG